MFENKKRYGYCNIKFNAKANCLNLENLFIGIQGAEYFFILIILSQSLALYIQDEVVIELKNSLSLFKYMYVSQQEALTFCFSLKVKWKNNRWWNEALVSSLEI